MTTIVLNERAKAKWNGDSWQPVLFVQGGKEVFSPAHKKVVETEDKWVTHAKYFSDLKYLIRYVAKEQCLSTEEYSSLEEYLTKYTSLVEEMLVASFKH